LSLNIAYLGTYHPAEDTLLRLAKKSQVSILIMPEEAGYKNDELIRISEEYKIPWSYNLEDISAYDVDIILAANYPKLVPVDYLNKYYCLNTHWSALPKYRGVHPTAWAVINGDEEIAVTVQLMDEEFDTGDILKQGFIRMELDMDIVNLHDKLSILQADLVDQVLDRYIETGEWNSTTQDESLSSYVPVRVPDDGIIDWNDSAKRIWNLVRAVPPPVYPGAFSFFNNEKIIISKAVIAKTSNYYCTVGQVVRVLKGNGVWIKAGEGCLEVSEIIFQGQIIAASEILKRGDRLGYDAQLEIARMKKHIGELTEKVQKLSAGK